MTYSLMVIFVVAVMNLVMGCYNYWKHRMHAGWLLVTGHIETSDLRNDQKDSYLLEMLQRAAFVAEVAYSYTIKGTYYSGRSDVAFSDEAEAWNYLDRHRKGETVRVYYDPEEPERSSVEPGTANYRKYLAAGLAFLVLGVALYGTAHPHH